MNTLIIILFPLIIMSGQDEIKLVKTEILEKKLFVLLPHNFELLPDEILKMKYPTANRPKIVYSNKGGTINFAFNHTKNKVRLSQLSSFKSYMEKTFSNMYPTAVWISKELKKVNGVNFGVLEFISPAMDTKIYNLMYYTSVNGRLLICSFNCLLKQKSEWEEIAKKMYQSIKIGV